MNPRQIASTLCLLCLAVSPAWGAPAAKKAAKPAAPVAAPAPAKPAAPPAVPGQPVTTNIKAERMDYDADKQVVVFTNNVYVKRPDFELWAEKMTVFLKKVKKEEKTDENGAVAGMEAGDIDYIVAERNVRMKREDKSSTSQKATYYSDSGKIVLEGSPVLTSKDSVVKGTVVTHYMKENKSEVAGGADIEFSSQDGGDKGSKKGGLNILKPSGGKK